MKHTYRWMLTVVMMTLTITACESENQGKKSAQAKRLIESAYKARNYSRLLTMADSLQKTGELSLPEAYYWRGYASDRLLQKRMAEFYWKASLEAAAGSSEEEVVDLYAKTASHLANLLCVRGDYDGTLKIAEPAAERLEKLGHDNTSDYVNLLIYIGCCQAASGFDDAAAGGFNRAYQKHLDNIEKRRTDASYKNAIAGLINIAYCCLFIKQYDKAISWIDHFGELLTQYEQLPDANADYIDKQMGRFDIYRAQAFEGLDKQEEAAKVFESFLTTKFSKSAEGRILANDYLFAANRWDEAANNYASLDALLGNGEGAYSTDNIQNMVLKKYQANLLAGRRDTAIAVSLQICDSLQHAFDRAKKLDAEEQATIVQEVELMTEQRAQSARNYQIGIFAALILVFLAFMGYTLYRRRAVRKLIDEHEQLKASVDKVAGDTTEQTRMEIRQRLADETRQAVIPAHLPQHQAVETFASQTPAIGIGSDLYDLHIRDEKLFFMIGDVTGGSSKASVAMAVLKAEFRAASVLDDVPERIVEAMKLGLSGLEQPVTFFIGVLDLATGQLAYTNADHIAPLAIGSEIKPLSDDVKEIALEHGTTLFLYTKGLLEAENADQKTYGERRLLGEVLQATKLDPRPKPVVECILASLNRFTGETVQKSDQTMLAIRWK